MNMIIDDLFYYVAQNGFRLIGDLPDSAHTHSHNPGLRLQACCSTHTSQCTFHVDALTSCAHDKIPDINSKEDYFFLAHDSSGLST